jgi:hypothetical protein
MKLSKKHTKPCECGSTEFVTQPNSYDIYELIDDILNFQRSELIDSEIKFYCRDCGKEFKTK